MQRLPSFVWKLFYFLNIKATYQTYTTMSIINKSSSIEQPSTFFPKFKMEKLYWNHFQWKSIYCKPKYLKIRPKIACKNSPLLFLNCTIPRYLLWTKQHMSKLWTVIHFHFPQLWTMHIAHLCAWPLCAWDGAKNLDFFYLLETT